MSLASAVRNPCLLTGSNPRLPRLIMITDRNRQGDPAGPVSRLPIGSAVILRDYDADNRPDLARQLRKLTRAQQVLLLIAGDEALAAQAGADGLHLPEHLLSDAAAIRRRHPGWLITAAAHSSAALRKAQTARLDAALLSPVFPTRSHPNAPVLGPYRHRALQNTAPRLPVYALGGVNTSTARQLPPGVQGWAAIDGI